MQAFRNTLFFPNLSCLKLHALNFSIAKKKKKRIELHPLVCQPHTGETSEKEEEEEEVEEEGGAFITMLTLTRRFTQKLCT